MKLKDLRIGNIYEINGNRRVLDTEDICNAIEYCDYDSDDVSYIQPSRIIDSDIPILRNINCYENLNVEVTNKEMELFKAFKEASKTNPNLTYEEFLKK